LGKSGFVRRASHRALCTRSRLEKVFRLQANSGLRGWLLSVRRAIVAANFVTGSQSVGEIIRLAGKIGVVFAVAFSSAITPAGGYRLTSVRSRPL